jgi:xanthine dehydrogenase accessory factor
MLVWSDGFSGTIGGGALEHRAIETARTLQTPGARRLTTHALGPDLGQCCGGSVELLTEVFDSARAEALPGDVIFSGTGEMPLAVARLRAKVRTSGARPAPQLVAGWMVEPVTTPSRDLWIWGAGHVGRAIVGVLAPLPEFRLRWIDIAPERFPADLPAGVEIVSARAPDALVPFAPRDAEHLIVTLSHELDLALCHALLRHGFGDVGLIGSKTKWARFRTRLAALGHTHADIARIACPIGDPALGKHPQAIALGVGAALLAHTPKRIPRKNTA